MRAECNRQKGHLDAAFKDITACLKIEPDNAKALACRAKCQQQKGKLFEALQDLQKALEIGLHGHLALECKALIEEIESEQKALDEIHEF